MQVLVESKTEGLVSLIGKQVILFCGNYFYAGKLAGVNKTQVKLTEPSIVYETGAFTAKGYADAQRLHVDTLYVRIPAIEAYAEGK